MSDVPAVEALLGRVATVAGREVAWAPLPGGLSHRIYLVNTRQNRYVLRVLEPAVSAAGLGVPPAAEIENTLAAARTGVGARVVEVLPDVPALVLSGEPDIVERHLPVPVLQKPVTPAQLLEAVLEASQWTEGGADSRSRMLTPARASA